MRSPCLDLFIDFHRQQSVNEIVVGAVSYLSESVPLVLGTASLARVSEVCLSRLKGWAPVERAVRKSQRAGEPTAERTSSCGSLRLSETSGQDAKRKY